MRQSPAAAAFHGLPDLRALSASHGLQATSLLSAPRGREVPSAEIDRQVNEIAEDAAHRPCPRPQATATASGGARNSASPSASSPDPAPAASSFSTSRSPASTPKLRLHDMQAEFKRIPPRGSASPSSMPRRTVEALSMGDEIALVMRHGARWFGSVRPTTSMIARATSTSAHQDQCATANGRRRQPRRDREAGGDRPALRRGRVALSRNRHWRWPPGAVCGETRSCSGVRPFDLKLAVYPGLSSAAVLVVEPLGDLTVVDLQCRRRRPPDGACPRRRRLAAFAMAMRLNFAFDAAHVHLASARRR